IVDLGGLDETERETEAMRLAAEECRLPFDLGRGPVIRAALYLLDAAEAILALPIHHVASDGWSVGLILHELSALYDAALENRPHALPELPVQYVDYALWQRSWEESEAIHAQIAYWQKQLGGAPTIAPLPADYPRPPA